jgi:hypothetical protein
MGQPSSTCTAPPVQHMQASSLRRSWATLINISSLSSPIAVEVKSYPKTPALPSSKAPCLMLSREYPTAGSKTVRFVTSTAAPTTKAPRYRNRRCHTYFVSSCRWDANILFMSTSIRRGFKDAIVRVRRVPWCTWCLLLTVVVGSKYFEATRVDRRASGHATRDGSRDGTRGVCVKEVIDDHVRGLPRAVFRAANHDEGTRVEIENKA